MEYILIITAKTRYKGHLRDRQISSFMDRSLSYACQNTTETAAVGSFCHDMYVKLDFDIQVPYKSGLSVSYDMVYHQIATIAIIIISSI